MTKVNTFSALAWIFLMSCASQASDLCDNKRLQQKFLNSTSTEIMSYREDPADISAFFASPETVLKFHATKNKFLKFYDECSKKMTPKTQKCFSNLKNFFDEMKFASHPDYSMGYKISNQEVYQFAKDQNEKLFELPEFLKNGKLPADWKTLFKNCSQHKISLRCQQIDGWKAIEYQSDNCLSSTERNIVFFVPGEKFDQWIQVRTSAVKNEDIQMISVQKQSKIGDTLRNPRPYFANFSSDGKMRNVMNCVSCHQSGPRQIRYIPGSLTYGDAKTVSEMNAKIGWYGNVSHRPFLDLSRRGPELGKEQGCTQCHTESTRLSARAPLTSSNSLNIHAAYASFAMPPSLYEEHKDYFDIWKNADNLKVEERAKLMQIFNEAKYTCDIDQSRLVREKALKFLFDGKFISASEFKKAVQSLKDISYEAKRSMGQFMKTSKAEKLLWFQGGSDSCLSEEENTSKWPAQIKKYIESSGVQ